MGIEHGLLFAACYILVGAFVAHCGEVHQRRAWTAVEFAFIVLAYPYVLYAAFKEE